MKNTSSVLLSAFALMVFLFAALPCSAAKNKEGVQAPQEIGDIIYGCYKKVNGQLRIVNGPEDCNPSELPISWNSSDTGGGDASITYVTKCENTSYCVCDNFSTAGMVLSGYAECPVDAVLVSVGTPLDETDYGFQARCMYLDGAYADPAYISIRCLSLAVEANCSDGIDNDGDEMTDCDDADCAENSACTTTLVEICDDHADNDEDGAIDCDDPDCAENSACTTTLAEICDDHADNDEDGAIDCDDPDCAENSACSTTLAEICDDHTDNDEDGAVDCDDPDCTEDPVCQSESLSVPVEKCSDGIDNDGDGKIDCKDKDCKKTSACK